MIAKLIGGNNDGALMNIAVDEDFGLPPFDILMQDEQDKLRYTFVSINQKANEAIYEYVGICEGEN